MKRLAWLAALGIGCVITVPRAEAVQAETGTKAIRSSLDDQQTDLILRQVHQAWIKREWDDYKARFVSPDGRVVDNANGGVSHSEGQGYGMLLATFAGDKAAFQSIWAWTEKTLYTRPDGLASWKWDPAKNAVADTNNATDGDLLVGWALVRAATVFSDDRYAARAKIIAEAIAHNLVLATEDGPVLLPGIFGFKAADQPDGPIVNLSYYVFPALEALKDVAPDQPWSEIVETGYRIIDGSRFGPLRLPGDWISLAATLPAPAKNFPKTFGYDAIRIPLYLAWTGHLEIRKARFVGLWNAKLDLGPFVTDLDSGAAVRPIDGVGFKMVAALSSCLAGKGALPEQLTGRRDTFYYPATLRLLCFALIEERYSRCL